MVHFELNLTEEDANRIFAVKDIEGKTDLTAEQFAAQLLSRYVSNLFPAEPKYSDSGALLNPEAYRGSYFRK